MSTDTLLAVARAIATPDQWAGAALMLVALALVWLGSRRPRRVAPASVPPRPTTPRHGIRRLLPAVDVRTLVQGLVPRRAARAAAATPQPATAAVRRLTPRSLQGVDATVTRMARAGRDAGEIARHTGIARDAVRLVMHRDGQRAPERADAPLPVAAAPADTRARARTAPAASAARPARPARTMPAVDARRDPRMDDARERARAADAGRGTRFSATVR